MIQFLFQKSHSSSMGWSSDDWKIKDSSSVLQHPSWCTGLPPGSHGTSWKFPKIPSSSSLFPPIHNTRFLGDNFKMLNFLSFSKLCNDTGTWSRRQLTVLCFSLTKNLFLKRFFFKESDLIWLLSSLENFHKCKIHPHTMSLIIRQVLFLVHLISPYLSFQEQWHVANTI